MINKFMRYFEIIAEDDGLIEPQPSKPAKGLFTKPKLPKAGVVKPREPDDGVKELLGINRSNS